MIHNSDTLHRCMHKLNMADVGICSLIVKLQDMQLWCMYLHMHLPAYVSGRACVFEELKVKSFTKSANKSLSYNMYRVNNKRSGECPMLYIDSQSLQMIWHEVKGLPLDALMDQKIQSNRLCAIGYQSSSHVSVKATNIMMSNSVKSITQPVAGKERLQERQMLKS